MLENDQNLNTTGTIVLHPGKPFFVANQSCWVKFQLYETNISASYGLNPLQSGGGVKNNSFQAFLTLVWHIPKF